MSLARWGDGITESDGYRSDAFLQFDKTRGVIWALSEVLANGLVTSAGDPVPTPNIRFTPFLKRDQKALASIMANLASPKKRKCSHAT